MEWSIETAFNVAEAFLQYAGLQGERLRLVRFRQNALLHAPNRQLTLRIYNPAEDPTRAAGYPEKARQEGLEALREAQRSAHPYTLVHVLTHLVFICQCRRINIPNPGFLEKAPLRFGVAAVE